jgi:hypothetical protein
VNNKIRFSSLKTKKQNMSFYSKNNLLVIAIITVCLASCVPTPNVQTGYNNNPDYTHGFAYYYGAYYSNYGNPNTVLSLHLLTDSLVVNDYGELEGVGNYLSISEIFLPPDEVFLPDGEYTAANSEDAFTFSKGGIFSADSLDYIVGSCVYYIEKNAQASKSRLVESGKFTVTHTGSISTMVFDFMLENNVHLQGTYRGVLPYYYR